MRVLWLLVVLLVCQLAAIIAPIRAVFALATGNIDRAWAIAKAYDFLGNAATNGAHNEFISARAYRAQMEGRRWGCVLCRLLDHIDKGHCKKSANIQPTA